MFHDRTLSSSMRSRNFIPEVSLTGRSQGSNSWTWVTLYEYQCRMFHKMLCTVLTGMPKDGQFPDALRYFTLSHGFSCNAVATSSTDVKAAAGFHFKWHSVFETSFLDTVRGKRHVSHVFITNAISDEHDTFFILHNYAKNFKIVFSIQLWPTNKVPCIVKILNFFAIPFTHSSCIFRSNFRLIWPEFLFYSFL